MAERDEELIYQIGDIIVSRTLARFGGISYPINGIGSVFVQKPNRIIYYAIGGALLVAGVFNVITSGGSDKAGAIPVIVGLGLLVIGFTRTFNLVLRTASGDQQALKSRNAGKVINEKKAIEKAVALRG
ncbi:MAG: DUF6232 family protein [Hyphomicrobiaceae bacterium]